MQEWYLIKPPNGQLSGFESEALEDFGAEGFVELLGSGIAESVELCNYDRSECIETSAIVLGKIQDTKLKTVNRQILFPIGSCHAGMYVKYDGRYWLITGLVDNNGVYEKAVAQLCNCLLTWMNDAGEVVQRWANASSAVQYNSGETSTKYYNFGSDQLMIQTPDDDECVMLNHGKRFVIDKRCKVYERNFIKDGIEQDTSKEITVYQLTGTRSVIDDYQDSGVYTFMANQDEQRNTDGYYTINGKGYWLCDPILNDSAAESKRCEIVCDSCEVYDGIEATEFIARFYDENGGQASVAPQWDINCEFKDELTIDEVDDAILISVDNPKLVNKSFELSLSGDGYGAVSVTVHIRAFM